MRSAATAVRPFFDCLRRHKAQSRYRQRIALCTCFPDVFLKRCRNVPHGFPRSGGIKPSPKDESLAAYTAMEGRRDDGATVCIAGTDSGFLRRCAFMERSIADVQRMRKHLHLPSKCACEVFRAFPTGYPCLRARKPMGFSTGIFRNRCDCFLPGKEPLAMLITDAGASPPNGYLRANACYEKVTRHAEPVGNACGMRI